ncbi:hypothetical protein SBRCBS47491_009995 [Sporothrix bragantina]|uniref:Uncharacterized protein n=1 Tax=Sporothrix bragantina TaxID=671064 RepID=A0ABP0CZC9_9PEZI
MVGSGRCLRRTSAAGHERAPGDEDGAPGIDNDCAGAAPLETAACDAAEEALPADKVDEFAGVDETPISSDAVPYTSVVEFAYGAREVTDTARQRMPVVRGTSLNSTDPV